MKVEVLMGWQWVWAMGLVALAGGAADVAFADSEVVRSLSLAGGKTVSVDGAGRIHLDSGDTIELWGLKITDLPRFRQLAQDRTFLCVTILWQEELNYADCNLAPASGKQMKYLLVDLFTWLVELEIAEYDCSNPEYSALKVVSMTEIYYHCENGKPIREYNRVQ
jgi:hypothetical protein